MSDPRPVAECPMPAGEHMQLGYGGDPAGAYAPHAHPFGTPFRYGKRVNGLAACCTQDSHCRITGHITYNGQTYQHVEGGDDGEG